MTRKGLHSKEGRGHRAPSPSPAQMNERHGVCPAGAARGDSCAAQAEHPKKSHRWLAPALAVLLVLSGLCLLLYPVASDYLNKIEQAKVSNNLRQVVQEATPEDLSAWRQQAIDYNDRLFSGAAYVIDPFDPDAPKTSDEEYLACLNLAGDGAMGTISIPSIGVDLPIYHGVTGEGMDHGVGHESHSSLPVGGPSTHAVLAGHTGLPSAVIFDKLDKLHVGDYFVLQVLDEDLAYRVASTEVVLPDDTSSLAIQKDKDLVTLVTCTPYGVNSHRLLIHAERCDVPKDWLERKDRDTGLLSAYNALGDKIGVPPALIGVLLAIAVLAAVYAVSRRRKHRGGRDNEGAR